MNKKVNDLSSTGLYFIHPFLLPISSYGKARSAMEGTPWMFCKGKKSLWQVLVLSADTILWYRFHGILSSFIHSPPELCTILAVELWEAWRGVPGDRYYREEQPEKSTVVLNPGPDCRIKGKRQGEQGRWKVAVMSNLVSLLGLVCVRQGLRVTYFGFE